MVVTHSGFLAYIPSPSTNGLSIGPFRLHVYGVLIACGIAAAVWLAQKRWEQIGGKPGMMSSVALYGVPGGLIGSRVYSLATSWNADTQGIWYRAFEIWRGGLGIWGGVIGGIALGWVGARRYHLPIGAGLDCVSPAFAIGQAIGRWGNYFNQELYGRPSKLPWAVKIDNPPAPYAPHSTFQPTFLYESIWDIGVLFLVIWVERRFKIKRGYLFTVYAAAYTAGRFWIEYLRIDEAHRILGLRLNDWTSILVFAAALVILVVWGRAKEGDDRAGTPLTGLLPDQPEDPSGSDLELDVTGAPAEDRALVPDSDGSKPSDPSGGEGSGRIPT
jgi:prolipoprotein diacylglyceryl transferase